jgi:hypothetical protein
MMWRKLGLTAMFALPAIVLRLTGTELPSGLTVLVYGAGVVASAVLLSWAAEARHRPTVPGRGPRGPLTAADRERLHRLVAAADEGSWPAPGEVRGLGAARPQRGDGRRRRHPHRLLERRARGRHLCLPALRPHEEQIVITTGIATKSFTLAAPSSGQKTLWVVIKPDGSSGRSCEVPGHEPKQDPQGFRPRPKCAGRSRPTRRRGPPKGGLF